MNSQQIQAFFNIAESESFNSAEKRGYVSRQALKKQIDSLEEALGFKLFVRTAQGSKLTEAGKMFYDGIKDITHKTDDLIRKCRSSYQQDFVIKVGSPSHPRLILEDLLSAFSREYPDIQLDVVFVDEAKNVTSVLNKTVDVAECILTSKIANNPKLEYIKLADLPYKCILAKNHPLAQREELTLQDLSGNTVGLRHNSNKKLIEILRSECTDVTLEETPGSTVETQKIFTICYNQGIFLSRAYFTNFMAPLVTIPLSCDLAAESCLIFKKNPSRITKLFVEVAKKHRIE